MSLIARRLVFYFLALLFLVVAPLLAAYTTGYRYHFKQRRAVTIGALSITTLPEGASIALNGKTTKYLTPALIVNLLPGSYDIFVQKEGYHPWQKTLPIESEKTTFAHNLPLFLRTTPSLTTMTSLPKLTPEKNSILKLPHNFNHYKVFYDPKRNTVVVIDNEKKRRAAELNGSRALWREKPTPLLFTYSDHEVWQWNPADQTRTLIARLIEPIKDIVVLQKMEVVLLVLENKLQAVELDLRDRQNHWDLATFENIEQVTLIEEGRTVEIQGTQNAVRGIWKLPLR